MKIAKRWIAVVITILLFSLFSIGEVLAGPVEGCQALLWSRNAGQINTADIVLSDGTLPEYCRVTGTLAPAVNFEVRLPTTGWNGKLLHQGGGAFCGSVSLDGANDALTRGYAVTATDTGHQGNPFDGSFGYNNTEAEIDFGFRAVHVVTEAAKHITHDYYRHWPRFSYFRGCSTGGRQALIEAQRFPEDFDGIIAGDPANFETGLDVLISYRETVNRDAQHNQILPINKLALVRNAVYGACDSLDGLIDGIIDDPRRCNFDPAALQCPDGNPGINCLSSAQVDVLDKFYDAPRNSKGDPLYPGGEAKGSELGWPGVSIGIPGVFPDGFGAGGVISQEAFRYLDFTKDPGPSYSIFDFNYDTDVEKLHPKAQIYNADDAPTGFRGRGGKLILYTGWADPQMSPSGVIYYYDRVVDQMGGLRRTQNWFRLFMVPGMYHCGGGPGPNTFDMLTPLENWVEHDVAPDQIIASHFTGGVVDRTRPLCPFPKVARLKSAGLDINKAENFNCEDPDYGIPPNDWDNIDRFPWQ